MTTGLLFDTINPEPTRRRHVPDTSKAAHIAGINAGRIGKRGAEVLEWVIQAADAVGPVTSAEVAKGYHDVYPRWSDERMVLYVRRGLTDLQKQGYITKGEDRRRAVTGTKANTWKVVTR